ncbi:MAG: LysR family transcriptional regulator [Parasutterella sp.]
MHKNQFGITRMNLEHLKTFHVVASLGSFTEAAKALYMTQPAVSQQIQGSNMHSAIRFSIEVNVRYD